MKTKNHARLAEHPWPWLLLALVLYVPFIDTQVGPGNVSSDLAAIESLVERGTFFINDSTFFGTLDKFKRDDHYFSQKSPIFHLVAAVPYLGMVKAGYRLSTHPQVCLSVLVVFMTILPMGLLLWLIYINPWVRVHSIPSRFGFAFVFACGSLLAPFATTLNHYTLASVALLAAVHFLLRLSFEDRPPSRREALLIGLMISLSIASDIPPGFLFGVGIAGLWIWKFPRSLPLLAAGALPIALLYMGLNMMILESPLPPNLHEKEMMRYEGSYWDEVYDAIERGEGGYYADSYTRRLFHSTLGARGIYWMMPLLSLATAAAAYLLIKRRSGYDLALFFALFPPICLAVAMNMSINPGGGTYSMRFAFATVAPLFIVLAHPGLPRPGLPAKFVVALAVGWGILMAVIGFLNPWSHNKISAVPPLENLAMVCLEHSDRLPVAWIHGLIERTSIEPDVAWLDLGLAHLKAERLEDAEYALSRSIAENPKAPLPYYHLGVVQDMAGRPGSAIRTYGPLLQLQPENAGAWNNLGLFYLHEGHPRKAKEAYSRSLELQPGNELGEWGLNTIRSWEAQMEAQD